MGLVKVRTFINGQEADRRINFCKTSKRKSEERIDIQKNEENSSLTEEQLKRFQKIEENIRQSDLRKKNDS